MMTKSFKFKRFTIQQDRCAMKIGTDGVLLGAWASLDTQPESILDIGSGTGIIALQLAQRSEDNLSQSVKTIDAVEMNSDAFEQCVENFERSPWNDRLFCYHASLQEFVKETEISYDLIISNPPFYSDPYLSKNKARKDARSTQSLPFMDLIFSVSELLSEKGLFAVIIPEKEKNMFIELTAENGLFPSRVCRVRGTKNTAIKRVLIEFCKKKGLPDLEEMTIEHSRHHYTDEYLSLVKDFYLKM